MGKTSEHPAPRVAYIRPISHTYRIGDASQVQLELTYIPALLYVLFK